jgi:hypothetical protein
MVATRLARTQSFGELGNEVFQCDQEDERDYSDFECVIPDQEHQN